MSETRSPARSEAAPDILARVFAALSSVKLLACTLLSCAAFFALASVIWEEPEAVVRQVLWVKIGFEAVLVFLALNVFAVALSRYPWGRREIGLLLALGGLLLTFAGALITARFGVRGTITLAEGERTDRYRTGRDVLSLRAPGGGGHGLVPYEDLPLRGLIGGSRGTERGFEFALADGTRVLVDRYYGHYTTRKVWMEGGAGAEPRPALEVLVAADGRETPQMLPALQAAALGSDLLVVFIPFVDEEIERIVSARRREARAGTLVVETPGGEPLKFDVRDSLGKPAPLEGGYSLHVEQYFPNLVVRDNRAANEGERPLNPAVRIRVTGPDQFDRTEWLFPEKEAPEFLGRIGLDDRFRFSYDFGERLTNVYLLRRESGVEFVIAAPGAEPQRSSPGPGGRVAVGPDFELSVARVFENAVEVEEEANDGALKRPAIHVVWKGKGEQAEAWVPFGASVPLSLGDSDLWFQYTQLEAALPFELELKDIRLTRYGGTEALESFESLAVCREGGGAGREQVISMNDPLEVKDPEWGTWRVFQSSDDPGGGATSTFHVSCDPGRPVVFTGFIAVCAGVFFMFWIKPFLRKRPGEEAAACGR